MQLLCIGGIKVKGPQHSEPIADFCILRRNNWQPSITLAGNSVLCALSELCEELNRLPVERVTGGS